MAIFFRFTFCRANHYDTLKEALFLPNPCICKSIFVQDSFDLVFVSLFIEVCARLERPQQVLVLH